MHILERGMIWVKFSDPDVIFTEPEYERVEDE
jgi:hypothetical protein